MKSLKFLTIGVASILTVSIANASDHKIVTHENILTSKYYATSMDVAAVNRLPTTLKSNGLVTQRNVLTSKYFAQTQQSNGSVQIATVNFDSVNDAIITDENILSSQYIVETYQSLN